MYWMDSYLYVNNADTSYSEGPKFPVPRSVLVIDLFRFQRTRLVSCHRERSETAFIIFPPPSDSMSCLVSFRSRNQRVFRHSLRNVPLKLSTNPYTVCGAHTLDIPSNRRSRVLTTPLLLQSSYSFYLLSNKIEGCERLSSAVRRQSRSSM
jgi:hypothetical protein